MAKGRLTGSATVGKRRIHTILLVVQTHTYTLIIPYAHVVYMYNIYTRSVSVYAILCKHPLSELVRCSVPNWEDPGSIPRIRQQAPGGRHTMAQGTRRVPAWEGQATPDPSTQTQTHKQPDPLRTLHTPIKLFLSLFLCGCGRPRLRGPMGGIVILGVSQICLVKNRNRSLTVFLDYASWYSKTFN